MTPKSSIAYTPNPIPSAAETETELYIPVGDRLLMQHAEVFIDRIMTHKHSIPKRILKPRFAIPVRRPWPTEIVYVASVYKLCATGWPMIADPATGEVYFISPYVLLQSSREIQNLCVSIGFGMAVSTKGASFLWPYPADFYGTLSAAMAVEEARDHWVCITVDKTAGDYHLERHTGHFEKPSWPRLEHDDVLDIIFFDREIDSDGDGGTAVPQYGPRRLACPARELLDLLLQHP
jgi:hypothetical protein